MRSPTNPTSHGPARRGAALLCWGLSRRGTMRLCGERLGCVGMGVEECGWVGWSGLLAYVIMCCWRAVPLSPLWRRVAAIQSMNVSCAHIPSAPSLQVMKNCHLLLLLGLFAMLLQPATCGSIVCGDGGPGCSNWFVTVKCGKGESCCHDDFNGWCCPAGYKCNGSFQDPGGNDHCQTLEDMPRTADCIKYDGDDDLIKRTTQPTRPPWMLCDARMR